MSGPSDTAALLIVDDMEENLAALEAVLGSLARIVRAGSGEEALKAMLRQEFAVVLIDVVMPGMDGFETAANIKGLDQTKDVPVILLTGAEVDPNYAYRGYTVGAADFLVKPFDPWLLRTKVNVFLELYRKNRQLATQSEQLRRLLTSEGGPDRPATPTGATPASRTELPASPTGAAPASRTESGAAPGDEGTAGNPPPGGPPSDRAAVAARLAEVVGQLTEAEGALREGGGAEPSGVADRIAEIERAAGRLLADCGKPAADGGPAPDRP
ncbi:response regulator [Streptomyces benahoarensis]|uniref:Response regulator n=1 Tax=Streptomyces benahoarensis TaxID=2595054 RepID=A0A553Z743_9ACTN|nr:response regulator [Streptomyces benahoarensis]TSB19320.1 response regulator [Streptomyces benahoarensis]TSB37247.1 response regulator [Streptomyces benahoarensis]